MFVDPVPDRQIMEKMYTKSAYHDQYYAGQEVAEYGKSASLLRQYLRAGSSILDYGCGVGGFLKACKSEAFIPFGVEFDVDAALFAARNSNCETMPVDAFWKMATNLSFDAIHMGDVLEHLIEPAAVLTQLIRLLRPGGALFLEGPIEENPSPVLWAARLFGRAKRVLKPTFVASHPPTHLFRTDAKSQLLFLARVDESLILRHWEIYETGWPYRGGGVIKSLISYFAVWMSGRHLPGAILGNRFKAVLIKP